MFLFGFIFIFLFFTSSSRSFHTFQALRRLYFPFQSELAIVPLKAKTQTTTQMGGGCRLNTAVYPKHHQGPSSHTAAQITCEYRLNSARSSFVLLAACLRFLALFLCPRLCHSLATVLPLGYTAQVQLSFKVVSSTRSGKSICSPPPLSLSLWETFYPALPFETVLENNDLVG